MLKVLVIVWSALFTAATAWALGALLLRRLRLHLYREEERIFALVGGYAVLSGVVFALAAAQIAYNAVFAAFGLGAIGLALRLRAHRSEAPPLPPAPRNWSRFFFGIYGIFALLYLVHALAPEMSPDGSAYHLGLVGRYHRAHGLVAIPANMYASLSQGIEMLFLFAFVFGRHSAAALVHCSFLLTLPLAMFAYARRFGLPRAGIAAALFVFLSPVVGVDGVSAYNDVAVACILFTCFYALQIWDAERTQGLLVFAGILAGFAFAAKYTAFLATPYALGFVWWKQRRGMFRNAATILSGVTVMALPWFLKNAIVVGNPFAPFLNNLFPNPWYDLAEERSYSALMRFYEGLKSYAEIPLEVTVRGQTLGGFLGPLFLLAPFALGAVRSAVGRRLLFAACFFALPYAANIGTRFLIPALPFVALSMAVALESIPAVLPALVLVHVITCWPGVAARYSERWAWRLKSTPIRAALRLESEDAFLTREWRGYRIARLIDGHVPRGAKVFAPSPISEAYTSREIIVGSYSTPNRALLYTLWAPAIPGLQPVLGMRFRFQVLPLRAIRLWQDASDASDNWSISELHILRNEAEVPRSESWRIDAAPNPFEAALALDNNPATRWSSRETLRPGMRFGVEFAAPVVMDSVLLRCVQDQRHTRLRLEGQTENGAWIALSAAPEQFELGPPLGFRQMAAEEFHARGIGYVAVAAHDAGLDDYFQNADLWGLELIGEESGTRLYRFKNSQK